jgi:hypothetical protein
LRCLQICRGRARELRAVAAESDRQIARVTEDAADHAGLVAVIDAKRTIGFGLAHRADPALTRQHGLVFIPRQAVRVANVFLFPHLRMLLPVEPLSFVDFRPVSEPVALRSRERLAPLFRVLGISLSAFRVFGPVPLLAFAPRGRIDLVLVGIVIGKASRVGFLPELRVFGVSPSARLVVASHLHPRFRIRVVRKIGRSDRQGSRAEEPLARAARPCPGFR